MASSILLKKQEELNARLVRDLLRLPENKKCFDCPIKSPFFVNVTLSTFVCTRCSGLVREVGHRVKSISASTFTGSELLALELGGNGIAGKIWLSCGYNTADTPEPESDGEVRGFMRQKYYERKWLNYDLAVAHDLTVKNRIKELFTEDGLPKQQQRRRRATMENNTMTNGTINFDLQQNIRPKKTIPTTLDLTSTNKVQPSTIHTAPLIMNAHHPQSKLTSPNQPKVEITPKTPGSVSVSPLPTQQSASPMDSFFSDLAGLTLADTPIPTQTSSHTHSHDSHQLQPTGSILTPTSLNHTNPYSEENSNKRHSIQPIVTNSAPRTVSVDDGSSVSSHKRATSLHDTDPYSALRTHHLQNQQYYEQTISAIRSITPLSPTSSHFDHSLAKKQDTKNTNTNDPYAALRQLSDGPDRHVSVGSSPAPPLSASMIPQSITNVHWPPPPTKQEHHWHPDASFDSKAILSKQDKSYLKNKTEEWVQASLHLANSDADNMMTPLSTSSSSSATHSTASSNINNKNIKSNTSNAFGDLDPLAAYKQKKMMTSSNS